MKTLNNFYGRLLFAIVVIASCIGLTSCSEEAAERCKCAGENIEEGLNFVNVKLAKFHMDTLSKNYLTYYNDYYFFEHRTVKGTTQIYFICNDDAVPDTALTLFRLKIEGLPDEYADIVPETLPAYDINGDSHKLSSVILDQQYVGDIEYYELEIKNMVNKTDIDDLYPDGIPGLQ